jgi:dopamine receptor D2
MRPPLPLNHPTTQFPVNVCNQLYTLQALRNRAIQARLNRKPLPSEIKPGSVIENVANTRRLAETTLGPATIEEQATNTGSGSGDEDEEGAEADCHVISNDKSTEFILATVVEEAA